MTAAIEWNPITGCSPISPGCANCYTMKLAGTALADDPARAGLTKASKAGPVWTGEVRLIERLLDLPATWRTPRHVYVCSHGDLFHENVPSEWIDAVFAAMEAAAEHRFQILTKRASRQRDYLAARWRGRPPPPHIWTGVSVERQREARQRLPALLRTPSAVRHVAFYPLLGPIDVAKALGPAWRPGAIAFALVGGERQRLPDPVWVSSIVSQCGRIGIPVGVGELIDFGEVE